MNQDILKQIGLTNNEIKIYLSILKLGRCSGNQVKKETKISNSQTYSGLNKLIDEGMIIYEKTSLGKRYSALDPNVIKKIIKERYTKIENQIPYLREIMKKESKSTETAIFEGVKGFKNALIEMVENCPKNETLLIIGFSNQAYKNESLSSILIDVNKISRQKNHKFKMILDNKSNKFYEQRNVENLSEIRFMKNGFKSPASIDIFQDQIYILIWGEIPYAIRIKNENVAEGFKTYFNFLWDMAKP